MSVPAPPILARDIDKCFKNIRQLKDNFLIAVTRKERKLARHAIYTELYSFAVLASQLKAYYGWEIIGYQEFDQWAEQLEAAPKPARKVADSLRALSHKLAVSEESENEDGLPTSTNPLVTNDPSCLLCLSLSIECHGTLLPPRRNPNCCVRCGMVKEPCLYKAREPTATPSYLPPLSVLDPEDENKILQEKLDCIQRDILFLQDQINRNRQNFRRICTIYDQQIADMNGGQSI